MFNKNLFLIVFFLSFKVFPAGAPTVIPEVNLHIAKKITEKPVQTTQIDKKTIAESPALTLTSLLSEEQSIVRLANNSGDYSQVAFSIRGFGDNAVANSLILVNGFPFINPSLLTPNFNSIALVDIERIEILQGSEGVLWGDQAVGGVVNIITKHPEKLNINAYLGIGSFNEQFYNLYASEKFKNGMYLKGFGYFNTTDNYREHNEQNNKNILLETGRDYSSGSLSVYLQAYEDRINFPGGLTQAQYDDDPREAVNFKNFIHLKTTSLQLLNKQELNAHWILESRFADRNTLGDGLMFSPFNREDTVISLSERFMGKYSLFQLVGGYEGFDSRYNFTNPSADENAHALQNNLFTQITWNTQKNLDVILGARLAEQKNWISAGQKSSNNDQVFVTEEGLAYAYDENWKFHLRRSGNFRFPKANEETWIPADVDHLKTQTGVSYELGGERKTDQQRTQMNIYQLDLKNEIAFDPSQTPQNPFGSYSNYPNTRRQGITITESYHVNAKLTLDSQLNYVNARFSGGMFSGKEIPAVPAFNGNVGMNYKFIENWAMKYFADYIGPRFASKDNENEGSKLAGYWLHNIALQRDFQFVNISFEINNFFNQKYSVYTLFDATSGTNTYYPGAGRNFLLTFKFDI